MAKQSILIVVMLFLSVLAKADTVWIYQGAFMDGHIAPGAVKVVLNTDLSRLCATWGVVTGNSSFQPLAWSFTDGKDTLTQANGTATISPFPILNLPFETWNFTITGNGVSFTSNFITTGESDESMVSGGGLIGHDIGYLNPHAWTETGTVDTPEPGSLLLLGAGLTGLALAVSLQKSLG